MKLTLCQMHPNAQIRHKYSMRKLLRSNPESSAVSAHTRSYAEKRFTGKEEA